MIEGREEIDWKRNFAFGAFGFAYLGGVQYMLYVPVMQRLYPGAATFAGKPIMEKLRDWRGMRDLCSQVVGGRLERHEGPLFAGGRG